VQHAFAEALARRSDFRGDGSLAAWVWKIALRHAVRMNGAEGTVAVSLGALAWCYTYDYK
jgi:DNA-directed RNA polymerase specialized sigma24 family protein